MNTHQTKARAKPTTKVPRAAKATSRGRSCRAMPRGALLGLLLLGLAATCGAQPLTGRYVNDEGRFIKLRGDGTFVAHAPFGTIDDFLIF